MILPPFESSHRDESDGIKFIKIRSLDIEIVKFEFSYNLLIIKVTWYDVISANFDHFDFQNGQIEVILVSYVAHNGIFLCDNIK
jgi:hypothetical protein